MSHHTALGMPILNMEPGISDRVPNSTSSHEKRFLSIPASAHGAHGPWPKGRIHYCFANSRSATALVDIVTHAIALWMPAYDYSALRILPDPACVLGTGLKSLNAPKSQQQELNYACVCRNTKQKVADDTLVIDDGRIGEQNDWRTRSVTTFGYDSTKQAAGRHKLSFGVMQSIDGPEQKNALITNMAHELGHVMGLQSEHQRADRDIYVTFNPRVVKGYKEAMNRAVTPQYRTYFPKGTEQKVCQNMVMNDYRLAEMIFPEFVGYMAISQEYHHPFAQYTTYDDKLGFDMGSIMMVNSDHDSELDKNGIVKYALRRKDKSGTGALLYMGGAKDRGRISVGDIKRIAVLYPGTEKPEDDAKELKQWKGGPKSIPGYVDKWLVEPNPVDVVPRQRDEDSKSQASSKFGGSDCSGTDNEDHHTDFEEDEHGVESGSQGHRSSSGSECPGSHTGK